MQNKLAVSILSLDPKDYQPMLDNLGDNFDILHFDIMDGKFVPHTAMGIDIVRTIKTDKVKWAHLMIANPEIEIPKYIDAGVDWITFHVEAAHEPSELIQAMKQRGVKVGIAINPHTHVDTIAHFLPELDHVLVMTVEPGMGGQSFQPDNLEKIKEIRKLAPEIEIAVDGGIGATTLPEVIQAGANVFVVGSAIVRSADPVQACKDLKAMME